MVGRYIYYVMKVHVCVWGGKTFNEGSKGVGVEGENRKST